MNHKIRGMMRSSGVYTCIAGLILVLVAVGACTRRQDDKTIVVVTTASTQDSGLFEYLLPIFKRKTGITVEVIAQGTEQALGTEQREDVDVAFLQTKDAELQFLKEGQGLKRYPVMYNDFVLIGPKSDPAGIRGTTDIAQALRAIHSKQAPFISRGDRSGMHGVELRFWNDAGIDIVKEPGPWYKSVGQGTGAADLDAAGALHAYVLSDRATWINFWNKRDLQIVVEGDKRLFNQSIVMLVNPEKHPNVQKALGQQFIDYLISPQGQRDIASYKIDGQQLFHPNAAGPEQDGNSLADIR